MRTISLLVTAAAIIAMPAVAQDYQPPRVRLLDDPFGWDAPPPTNGPAPDLRSDPIPAYQRFPDRWLLMQQKDICQPVLDPQTGRTTAWRCRMADGTTEIVR